MPAGTLVSCMLSPTRTGGSNRHPVPWRVVGTMQGKQAVACHRLLAINKLPKPTVLRAAAAACFTRALHAPAASIAAISFPSFCSSKGSVLQHMDWHGGSKAVSSVTGLPGNQMDDVLLKTSLTAQHQGLVSGLWRQCLAGVGACCWQHHLCCLQIACHGEAWVTNTKSRPSA